MLSVLSWAIACSAANHEPGRLEKSKGLFAIFGVLVLFARYVGAATGKAAAFAGGAVALLLLPATSVAAEQAGPWTALAIGAGETTIDFRSSGCYVDLDCRSFALSCERGKVTLQVGDLDGAELGRWFVDDNPSLRLSQNQIDFELRAVVSDVAGRWQAQLATSGSVTTWLAAGLEGDELALTTPSFQILVELTDADRLHFAAFADSCNGVPAQASCPLSEAVYVGDAGAVTFGDGELPVMYFSAADGAGWQAVHTGGHGRGANYYDRATDLYYEYWFNGIRGEIASVANAAAAPLTLTLERLGAFVRTCP